MHTLLTIPQVADPYSLRPQCFSLRIVVQSAWPANNFHPSALATPGSWYPTLLGTFANLLALSVIPGAVASTGYIPFLSLGFLFGAGVLWPGALFAGPSPSSPPSSGTESGLQDPPHLEKGQRTIIRLVPRVDKMLGAISQNTSCIIQ